MLPPVDGNVLKNNPRFEKLYNTITTSILNPDGSTKIDPSAKQRDAVSQVRIHIRLLASSTSPNRMTNGIVSIALGTQGIPPEGSKSPPPQHRHLDRRPKSNTKANQPRR